jgi:hypothetical protein
MLEHKRIHNVGSTSDDHDRPSGIRTVVPIADITAPSATFVVETLARAERTEGTELLAFGTSAADRLGELLISHGQVCLVALLTGQISLGARLAQRCPETAALVRTAVAAARSEGRPISGVLAELGATDSERIREALLDQIAEGLCELGRAAPEGLFESSLSASTRHLSTVLAGFAPETVYWHTLPLLFHPPEDAASLCFQELAESAGAAALCARSDGSVLPIHASGFALGGVASILKLGRDIEQMARPPALLAAGVQPSLMMLSSAGDSVLLVSTQTRIAVFGDFKDHAQLRALGVASRIVAGAT